MDEFEKDDILEGTENAEEAVAADENAENETAEVSAEEEAESKDELTAELEEIRDMFQKELDAAKENTNGEMLIQELEDVANGESHDADEEPEPAPLCECCGENVRSNDYGENYPYCDSCRELMKRYPLRWSGIATLFISVVLIIATAYFAISSLDSSIMAAEHAVLFESGKTYTAMQNSYSYLSSVEEENVSMKIVRKTIDAYVNVGYYSDAVSLIETYFSETELKLPWNRKYQKILDQNTVLTETYYAVSEIITPVANGQDYDYDEIMAKLDALKSMNPIEEGKSETVEKYDDVFIEYYKYILMSVDGKDIEEQLAQLKAVDEIGEGLEWVYLSNLCAVAAKAGDEETVNSAFERATEINKEDVNAYLAKASYYRFLETPDADKILEVCQEAAENSYNNDVSYKQYEAIAYLLKGEGAVALEKIEEAVASVYTVQTCNLYALCGLYNGQTEIYDEMKSMLKNAGFEISSLVENYKDGKMTIEEVLADKGGDI